MRPVAVVHARVQRRGVRRVARRPASACAAAAVRLRSRAAGIVHKAPAERAVDALTVACSGRAAASLADAAAAPVPRLLAHARRRLGCRRQHKRRGGRRRCGRHRRRRVDERAVALERAAHPPCLLDGEDVHARAVGVRHVVGDRVGGTARRGGRAAIVCDALWVGVADEIASDRAERPHARRAVALRRVSGEVVDAVVGREGVAQAEVVANLVRRRRAVVVSQRAGSPPVGAHHKAVVRRGQAEGELGVAERVVVEGLEEDVHVARLVPCRRPEATRVVLLRVPRTVGVAHEAARGVAARVRRRQCELDAAVCRALAASRTGRRSEVGVQHGDAAFQAGIAEPTRGTVARGDSVHHHADRVEAAIHVRIVHRPRIVEVAGAVGRGFASCGAGLQRAVVCRRLLRICFAVLVLLVVRVAPAAVRAVVVAEHAALLVMDVLDAAVRMQPARGSLWLWHTEICLRR